MFGPRARALARPVIANARSYATRPSPAAAGPAAAGSSLGRTLLLGATAISMFGLIASQRDSARMEAERQSKKVIRSDKGSKPVYTQEEASPAPAIIEKKEAEAKEETQKASSSQAADVPTGPEGDAQAAPAPAANQGAFNEETGEINWDCPCLGGMADGPCGEDFKAAFSCFVYSEAEPKGVDCVEKFKAMQDCFRLHPDVYGEEIDDDDEETPAAADAATTEQIAAPEGKEDIGAVDSIPPVAATPVETA